MTVVVVESPAKAKTINKYLGKDYTVLASYGHIRDLPAKDGSVRPNEDFAVEWEMDTKGAKHLREIAEALKSDKRLVLATDPDREGEAISWHVLEALRQKKVLKDKEVARVTFNAITKDSVLKAMAAPRDINMELVDAYLARRALDYLVGFTLSPVLWRKLPGARSAGRVQSVALRLITERELEIEGFKPQEYWTLDAILQTAGGAEVLTRLSAFEGKRLRRLDLDAATAQRALAAVKDGAFAVSEVEAKPVRRAPPPPFTTSTLQQEAARKLGFSATRTMSTAQRLYEGVDIGGETVGLITYMRTDGVQMAEEAYHQLRRVIAKDFGDRYMPENPRRYSSKAKNAQEAHEAIRPTDAFRRPDQLRLDGDQKRLYELIWKRAMASQMEAATLEQTRIDFKDARSSAELRATGQVVLFDGFFKLYQEGRDDPETAKTGAEGEEEESTRRLPKLDIGQKMSVASAKTDQHFTEPPPRYSEASLVKKLEELGIGRPSTYAATLEKLRERDYVRMDRNRFVPEDKGRLVTAFLENFFRDYVEYDFTAALETKLDDISAGDLAWKDFLRDFWKRFSTDVGEIGELRVSEVLEALNQSLGPHIFPARADGGDPRQCQSCGTGTLSLKVGKFGAFIGCSNYPECKYTRQLAQGEGSGSDIPAEGKKLGEDPQTGEPITLRAGRFGPYVQLGEGEKPKRSGLPKGWSAETIDLERALRLLSLPREVGPHPEDGEMILAGLGRYGPYIQKGRTYATLPGIDDAFEIGINRAVTLFEEKKNGGGRRGGGAQRAALKELGEHPETKRPVRVLEGRFGPYVSDGKIHATLPKGADPQAMTLAEALPLLAARAEKGGGKKGRAAKPKAEASPKKKAAAENAPAKKTASKKKPPAKKK
ncbi:MAG: type I DNA topoisomerase [Hyphomonadaceae bacterium]